MKLPIAILCFLFSSFAAFSQKDYFVYIQSDNRQPFYILMDGKTHSSSESGYVILSNLQGQAYKFVIGFPKNSFPEQTFIINVYNRDAGYQLKNFGEKGWGLFNYQTLEVIMSKNSETGSGGTSYIGTKKTDAFSVLLSNVVNDSSLLYQSVAYEAPAKQAPVVAAVPAAAENKATVNNNDTSVTSSTAVAVNATNTAPAADAAGGAVAAGTAATTVVAATAIPANNEAKVDKKDTLLAIAPTSKDTTTSAIAAIPALTKDTNSMAVIKDTLSAAPVVAAIIPVEKKSLSVVNKISEASSDTALDMAFTDSDGKNTDTIHISIPLIKEEGVVKTETPAPVVKQDTTAAAIKTAPAIAVTTPEKPDIKQENTTADVPKTETAAIKTETPQTPVNTDTAAAIVKTQTPTVTETKPAKIQINNSDCKNTATENDIDKLRVKLLSISSTEEKLAVTKKLLKTRCFTVKQLKAISEVYADDESKYQLFDAAYPFTLDTYNYDSLAELIKSDYYLNRFKAMLHH